MKRSLALISVTSFIISSLASFTQNEKLLISSNIDINIQNTKSNRILDSKTPQELGAMATIDLTLYTGISSIDAFKYIYESIELPNFYAEVTLMYNVRKTNQFFIPTRNWQENWSSEQKLMEYYEEEKNSIPFYYIYQTIMIRYDISNNNSLKHLMLKIYFFGMGDTNWEPLYRPSQIETGEILTFVGR